MTKKQLFTCYDTSLPDTVLNTSNYTRIHKQTIRGFPFTRWPNGRPCESINMYLLDIANSITGDTLKTYAAELSHLVRYCGSHILAFRDLTDNHVFDLSQNLQAERSLRYPTERARNNNSVRVILGRTLLFLQWFQQHLMLPGGRKLIGEKKHAPQISIQIKTNHHTRHGNTYITHRAFPSPISQEPKRPISQSIIEDVELMIEKLSILEAQNKSTLRRYQNDVKGLNAQLEYVRARRRFMIWLLKRAGLRPSEMVAISVNEHRDILKTKRIIIPTKKRRQITAPKRCFPITQKDAATFKRYLTARDKYLCALGINGIDIPDHGLFLGVNGEAIKKTSLEKDFSRLIKACGYENVQACVSMFRHRFITYEVIVHFKEFMSGSGKTRQLMTDADYRSILKRVATKTGHGSEESLWHYIDLAWEEMDVWGNIDRALDRLHAADQLYEELLDLRHEVETSKAHSDSQVLDRVTYKLNEIIGDVKAASLKP